MEFCLSPWQFSCRVLSFYHLRLFVVGFLYAEYITIKGTKKKQKTQSTAFWCTRKSGARNRIFAWFLFCTRCVNNKSCQRAGVSVWEFWEYVMRFEKIQTNANETVNKSAQNIHRHRHTYIEEIILTCANLISTELIDWLINRNIKSSNCCKWK